MRRYVVALAAAGMLALSTGAFANIAPGPRPKPPTQPTSKPTTVPSKGASLGSPAVIGLGAAAALLTGGMFLSRRRR